MTTEQSNRTAHLLELMRKGDDAFNARDFAAMDAVHDPAMIAHVTGTQSQSTEGRLMPKR